MKTLALICLAGFAVSAPGIAVAGDHGEKHRRGGDDDDRERHLKYGEACFREDHIRIIHDHYRPRSLPPGIEKKLYRTGRLPPGWEKKIQPFPYAVETRMPPLCSGCARGYMDGYALIYEPRSRLIIDIHAVIR